MGGHFNFYVVIFGREYFNSHRTPISFNSFSEKGKLMETLGRKTTGAKVERLR